MKFSDATEFHKKSGDAWRAAVRFIPSAELIGSEAVAVRLPFPRFRPHAPYVSHCKYKSAHACHPSLPFGQQHAISHCVRANAKPTGREFERQIQSGFHCKEPLGGCHEMQFDR
jgi:hypothetical protein